MQGNLDLVMMTAGGNDLCLVNPNQGLSFETVFADSFIYVGRHHQNLHLSAIPRRGEVLSNPRQSSGKYRYHPEAQHQADIAVFRR